MHPAGQLPGGLPNLFEQRIPTFLGDPITEERHRNRGYRPTIRILYFHGKGMEVRRDIPAFYGEPAFCCLVQLAA